jgi:hypothetical protein
MFDSAFDDFDTGEGRESMRGMIWETNVRDEVKEYSN